MVGRVFFRNDKYRRRRCGVKLMYIESFIFFKGVINFND